MKCNLNKSKAVQNFNVNNICFSQNFRESLEFLGNSFVKYYMCESNLKNVFIKEETESIIYPKQKIVLPSPSLWNSRTQISIPKYNDKSITQQKIIIEKKLENDQNENNIYISKEKCVVNFHCFQSKMTQKQLDDLYKNITEGELIKAWWIFQSHMKSLNDENNCSLLIDSVILSRMDRFIGCISIDLQSVFNYFNECPGPENQEDLFNRRSRCKEFVLRWKRHLYIFYTKVMMIYYHNILD